MIQMKKQIKPGFFGITAFADTKRREFDMRNEQVLHSGKKVDVVFFGDSITQYWDLELYFNQSALKINRGIGSDSTIFAAKRFEADVIQLEPEKIVILLGINDLLKVAPNLWDREPGADPETVISNIEKNFRDMLSKCKNEKVYICSILPQSLCEPYDRELFDRLIVRTNEILKNLCEEYGAEHVDYYSALCVNGGLPDDMTTDGVHPNAKAYEVMSKVLKEKVEIL